MKKDLRIHPKSQGHFFRYALDEFILDTQARQLAPATTEFYRLKLRPFIAYCVEHGAPNLEQVTSALIKQFMLAMSARGCTTQTVTISARTVRAFLNFCVRDGMIENQPLRSRQAAQGRPHHQRRPNHRRGQVSAQGMPGQPTRLCPVSLSAGHRRARALNWWPSASVT